MWRDQEYKIFDHYLDNDLHYTCAMVEFIGRKTKNKRLDVLNYLGKEGIEHLLKFADSYHCDSFEYSSESLFEDLSLPIIPTGEFDNLKGVAKDIKIPMFTDMGTDFFENKEYPH